MSLEEKVSPSKGIILKLPKKEKYHGYSDGKGILYFLDGELKSPVTKYHKSINKQGHETIPIQANKLKELIFLGATSENDEIIRNSISFGNHFWLFGIQFKNQDFEPRITNSNTALWYKKKQKFGIGPDLPDFLIDNEMTKYRKFCTLSLNSTHLMAFGFTKNSEENYNKVAFIDFYKNIWKYWISLNLEEKDRFRNCHASLVFDKNGNKKIWLVLEKYQYLANTNLFQLVLMSNLLSENNQWEIVATHSFENNLQLSMKIFLKFRPFDKTFEISVGGFYYKEIIYSILSDGTIIKFDLEKNAIQETRIKTNQSVMSVIPYLV